MEKIKRSLLRHFNPGCAPKSQRLAAKMWELLRRSKHFRCDVDRLRELDTRAKRETAEYIEIARQFNQALSNKGSMDTVAIQQRYNSVKDRPLRSETFSFIRHFQQTHPLAALALTWLVPDPEFTIDCKRDSCVQEGRGISPNFEDPSWIWRDVYDNNGRRIPKVGGESWVRGPEISAPTLTNPFPDWKNWKPGEVLFDCSTPWNCLPKSFKSRFLKEFKRHYDSREGYEFNYVRHPRETDVLNRYDAARYLQFLEILASRRLFAISLTILTTKDVVTVFQRIHDRLKKHLPESREHIFGSAAAWNHFLAIKEMNLPLAKHIVGKKYGTLDSTQVTELVRANRKNVQFGIRAIEKLIELVYPVFELKKACLVHSAPPRHKQKRRKQPLPKLASA